MDVMHLMVPPYTVHLDAVRAVAGIACDWAGLDADDREDLCLALDELCQLVVAATDFAILVTVTVLPSVVLAQVVARRRVGAGLGELPSLAAAVLARTVDFFALEPDDEAVAGVVVKCRTEAARP